MGFLAQEKDAADPWFGKFGDERKSTKTRSAHMKFRQCSKAVAAMIGLSALAVSMSGCVAGQSIGLRHAAGSVPEFTSGKTVSVESRDSREFIVNGDKDPSYLGHLRAGYGNTWGVKNAGGLALAEQFKNDLVAEMAAQGIQTASAGDRRLFVDILDWNFDAYQNGRVWYDLAVSVSDSAGKILASIKIKDEKVVRGSVMMGAAGAMKREVPAIYSDAIKEILGNRDIQKALK